MGRITHFEVHADDFDRATKFYAAVLDWQFQKWDGPAEYVIITTGPDDKAGINGGMVKRRGPIDGQSITAFVCTAAVDDVDNTIDKAVKAGGSVAMSKMAVPGIGWLVYLKDTEGNTFGALQPDASARI
jgi:predicted enzyme related to lactoylglutathione lyase